MSLQELVQKELLTLRVLHKTFLLSILLFAGVAYFITTGNMAFKPDIVVFMLVLPAVGSLAASYVLPKIMLSKESLRKEIDGLSGDEREKFTRLLPRFKSSFIVTLALRESVALFGLSAAMISGSFLVFLPAGVVSFLTLISAGPSEQYFEEGIRVARGL